MKLDRAFYDRPTLDVARACLGKWLFRKSRDVVLILRVIEVEAYMDVDDGASHSRNGATPRNQVMFGPAGHLYVYFVYGMHHCMNVVTESTGRGCAVLIRALEPMNHHSWLAQRRPKARNNDQLCNGPAKCCAALSVSLNENGLDLTGTEMWLEDRNERPLIESGPRIGIRHSKALPWRFWVAGHRGVSR
ncbi:MAG: DNA-3-methyladenine glycosylase [Acidobacteria bacterium]|nr:DNA-3-methyladenine glycosylase [Acidobacteriota bacterium]